MEAEVKPQPISARELPNLPETFLGLAALLVIVVGASYQSAFDVVMGLIMGAGALVSLGFAEEPLAKSLFSFLTISGCFGSLLVVRWMELLFRHASGAWQTWVTLLAGLLSLLAAYRAILLHRH